MYLFLSCHSPITYNLRQENEEGAYSMFTLRNPRELFQIIPFPQDSELPHQEASLSSISIIVSTGNWWMLGCRDMLRNTGFKQNLASTTFPTSRARLLARSVHISCIPLENHGLDVWKGLFPKAKHLPAKKYSNVWLNETYVKCIPCLFYGKLLVRETCNSTRQ